jgi:hypothetical protein
MSSKNWGGFHYYFSFLLTCSLPESVAIHNDSPLANINNLNERLYVLGLTTLFAPMNLVMIGGLITSSVLSLVVVPALYKIFTKEIS